MWRKVEKEASDERAAINAASCALDIQYKLHQFHLTKDVSLSLNISLGYGAIKLVYVCTQKNRSHVVYEGFVEYL